DEHAGDLAADADHLVAVVRVEDAVDVRRDVVEDREVVCRERADAAGAGVLVYGAATLEPAHRVRSRGAPHGGEGRIVDGRMGVRIEVHGPVDDERRGAALDSVPVALEV